MSKTNTANLEQELDNARETVAKFDRIGLIANFLTLCDLGGSGYAATFESADNLGSGFDGNAFAEGDYWFEHADDLPRTAKGKTAVEAIQKAIAKCNAEIGDFVKKNFRYSPEIIKEYGVESIETRQTF